MTLNRVNFIPDIAKFMCNFECINVPTDGRQFQDVIISIPAHASIYMCDIRFLVFNLRYFYNH